MQSLTIDREKITFDIPAESSQTGAPKRLTMRSNRLTAHLDPKSNTNDEWIVIRSKRYRYALILLTRILATRATKESISIGDAVADWAASWDLYLTSDYDAGDGSSSVSVQTSKGFNWGGGIHSHFLAMEEMLQGRSITPTFLERFGRDVLNIAGRVECDYDTKRALVLTYTRRGDAKITMWNRDIRIRGESLTYIVPHELDADNTMVAIDLAAKYTELLDGISFFNVLRHKYLVEKDVNYVKQRKAAKHLTREMLSSLKLSTERIIAASKVEFFPEVPNIVVPE